MKATIIAVFQEKFLKINYKIACEVGCYTSWISSIMSHINKFKEVDITVSTWACRNP